MMNIDEILTILESLKNYMSSDLKQVGIFDKFACASLSNVNIFIIMEEDAPDFEDAGWCLTFKELPDFIKQYGINCTGYVKKVNGYCVLIAPVDECSGNLIIKVPPKEFMPLQDPVQASLYELLDKPTSRVEYKGKTIGILSTLKISPVAEIALKTIEKILKRGRFEIVDEKTLVTSWRQRIEFGVRPVFFNHDVIFDIEQFLMDLCDENVKLDAEINVVKSVVRDSTPIESTLIVPIDADRKSYGKIVYIETSLGKEKISSLIAHNIQKYSGSVDFNTPMLNFLITLVSDAPSFIINGKEIPRSKIKIDKIDRPKSNTLRRLATEIGETLGKWEIRFVKVKTKKIKGECLIARSGYKVIATISH